MLAGYKTNTEDLFPEQFVPPATRVLLMINSPGRLPFVFQGTLNLSKCFLQGVKHHFRFLFSDAMNIPTCCLAGLSQAAQVKLKNLPSACGLPPNSDQSHWKQTQHDKTWRFKELLLFEFILRQPWIIYYCQPCCSVLDICCYSVFWQGVTWQAWLDYQPGKCPFRSPEGPKLSET